MLPPKDHKAKPTELFQALMQELIDAKKLQASGRWAQNQVRQLSKKYKVEVRSSGKNSSNDMNVWRHYRNSVSSLCHAFLSNSVQKNPQIRNDVFRKTTCTSIVILFTRKSRDFAYFCDPVTKFVYAVLQVHMKLTFHLWNLMKFNWDATIAKLFASLCLIPFLPVKRRSWTVCPVSPAIHCSTNEFNALTQHEESNEYKGLLATAMARTVSFS